jgi:macrolide-specific efflux system membrane fusion protein
METIEVPALLIKIAEQIDVPAREAGVLAAVPVREGQIVERGTRIAQIEDDEAVIAAQRAKIEMSIAQANAENDVGIRFAKKSLEVAKAELARSTEAVAIYKNSISASEMDRQRLLVDKGLVEVEQAQHEFKIAAFTRQIKATDYQAAEQAVGRRKITAPLGGMVVQVYRHPGEWVKPGEPVVRIVCLDHLRAEGFLNARYLSQELQDRKVKVTVDLARRPATVFPGKITFLDPEIDPVNGQFHVWIEVANQDLSLRPGMRAKMSLEVPR